MLKTECRICQAGESNQTIRAHTVYGGQDYHNFWQCSECGIIYLFPTLSEEEEKHFYAKEFEKFMGARSGTERDWTGALEHIRTNQDQVERRWKYLEKYVKKGMELLEIGCSSGFMLNKFKDTGLNCIGVEPSGEFLQFLKIKGYPVYPDINSMRMDLDIKFDLIVHFFVLEHIKDPFDFLKQNWALLKPGGKIIAEVPSATDPLTSTYNIPAFEKFYWSIAHHYYYTPESLTYILDRLGYRYQLLPEQRYDLSNHMTWMMDGKPGGQGRFDDIFSQRLNECYKYDLKNKWLCDTLILVISK